eukprot:CAMPEP_0197940834 /NCGR_PEP_ID=MMETSP1439-20131203/121862_1 /TAXON_ID=66791 /ORGANISM="Gonyaulax spinifera, Strain CCMP409" /LENGTH=184 /DNA_ID=CAMNT_0043564011 /DNA_START=36 /DNA_END=590 /DNA_ORIENTATION=+
MAFATRDPRRTVYGDEDEKELFVPVSMWAIFTEYEGVVGSNQNLPTQNISTGAVGPSNHAADGHVDRGDVPAQVDATIVDVNTEDLEEALDAFELALQEAALGTETASGMKAPPHERAADGDTLSAEEAGRQQDHRTPQSQMRARSCWVARRGVRQDGALASPTAASWLWRKMGSMASFLGMQS